LRDGRKSSGKKREESNTEPFPHMSLRDAGTRMVPHSDVRVAFGKPPPEEGARLPMFR
jgi:hypothetical protein